MAERERGRARGGDEDTLLEQAAPTRALTSDIGRVLSRPTKSQPFWPPRTPRWVLRFLDAASVPVQGGVYQVNRVGDEGLGTRVQASAPLLEVPSTTLRARHSHSEVDPIETSVAVFEPAPQEIPLEPIQSVVKTSTRVPQLFSETHDQLQWQINITAEYMYETKENLVFNHPTHGLLNNVAPNMEFKADGPPSPDVLDDLLARAWKRPDFFALHPEALAEFRKQASARSLTLEEVEIFGSSFSTWRGLPLVPTNKLHLVSAGAASGESASGTEPGQPALMERVPGQATTSVVLMRLGLEKQGIVSLYAAGAKTSPPLPFITVEFMRLGDNSVASYLLTTYTAVAVLSPGALARAEVTV